MRERLQRAWLRRGALALLLWPLSLVYGLVARLHRNLYRFGLLKTGHAGVPVVVIGNVVAGGAGKTPVLIAAVRHLKSQGRSVGVVSRGHGRRSQGCVEVTPDSDAEQVGDEPLLIARHCAVPVFVAERRLQAVQALRARHPNVQIVLSDDGLQHHALARDVEVCVFDDRGIGNGWLLPAGPLREPWPRQVDLVLRSEGTAGVDGFVVRRRLADHVLRADGTSMPLDSLRGQECDALAGIAQPDRFFDMLRARGIRLRHTIPLPDHFDFEGARRWADASVPLLCTEKDAVKLWQVEPAAWAVPLDVDIDPAFWSALEARLGPRLSSPHGSQAA